MRPNIVVAIKPHAKAIIFAISCAFLTACGNDDSGGGPPVAVPPPAPPPTTLPSALTAYEWKPVAVGGGGFIMSHSWDKTGATHVIRNDTYGAHIFSASQNRWVQLVTSDSFPAADITDETAGQGTEEVIVAPSNPDRLYLAFKGYVYRSDNRGVKFTRTALPQSRMEPNDRYRTLGQVMAVSPTDHDVALIGLADDGLWITRNAGAAWSRIAAVPLQADQDPNPDAAGLQGPGVLIWFNPAAPSEIWALSYGNGMFRSADNGQSWAKLSNVAAAEPGRLNNGGFAPDGSFFGVSDDGNDSGIWRYRGGRWDKLDNGLGGNFAPVAIAINPRNGEIWGFSAGGNPARSRDGGDTWQQIGRTLALGGGDPPWLTWKNNDYFTTAQVFFDPGVPDRIWGAIGDGVWRAQVPAGTSSVDWTSESRGIEQLVGNDVTVPPGGDAVLAGWDFGLRVKSDDDAFAATHGPHNRFNSVWDVDYTVSRSGFLVANTSDHRFIDSDGNGIQAGWSEDGGKTWTKFATLPKPPGTNVNDAFAMSFGSIAVSSDSPDNIAWMPAFNRAPFVTEDRGLTWSQIILPGTSGNATGSGDFFSFNRKIIAADQIAAGTFYIYHSGQGNPTWAGVYASTDKGRTWQKRFEGELSPFSRFNTHLKAVPDNAGHLFWSTGALDGINSDFRRSVDGGRTWPQVAGMTRVLAFGFGKAADTGGYPAIYVAGRYQGNYGLWRSLDNAANWKQIGQFPQGSLDSVRAIDGDKDDFGRVYMALGGSGWIYGTPSTCTPKAYLFGDRAECFGIR